MTNTIMIARDMALRIRRFRLPQSGKDWVLLGIMFVIIAAGMFLGKRFFPNLRERTLNAILIVICVLILIIGRYGE